MATHPPMEANMRTEHFKFGEIEITASIPEGVFANLELRLGARTNDDVLGVAQALEGADVEISRYASAAAKEFRDKGETYVGCWVSLDAPRRPVKAERDAHTALGRWLQRRRRRRQWTEDTATGIALLRRAFGQT